MMSEMPKFIVPLALWALLSRDFTFSCLHVAHTGTADAYLTGYFINQSWGRIFLSNISKVKLWQCETTMSRRWDRLIVAPSGVQGRGWRFVKFTDISNGSLKYNQNIATTKKVVLQILDIYHHLKILKIKETFYFKNMIWLVGCHVCLSFLCGSIWT